MLFRCNGSMMRAVAVTLTTPLTTPALWFRCPVERGGQVKGERRLTIDGACDAFDSA